MSRAKLASFLGFFLVVLPLDGLSDTGKSIKSVMTGAFASFEKLQGYMIDEEKFTAPSNNEAIYKLLDSLSTNFHDADDFDSKFQKSPGFVSNLRVIGDMLEDARKRFHHGNKGYALWRMRAVASHCIGCHTTYDVKVTFASSVEAVKGLDSFKQGEFYLATRQFDSARTAFYKAATDPALATSRMESLRKWLVIYTRVTPNPKEAIEKLGHIGDQVRLTVDEKDQISAWLNSLQKWSKESPPSADRLVTAKNLISSGLNVEDPLLSRVDVVGLLRASGLLHQLLDDKNVQPEQRRQALYLLGLSYSKLPLFFINEMPEFFLEQCILDYPGTEEAKQSYRLYKDIVTLDFTGSSGTHLPGDVASKLQELHDEAYGVVKLDDRA